MIHMRAFNALELKNQKFLVNHNVKFTQVQITATGLKKSILDSTVPMRAYFVENEIHDYEEQLQGQEHKKQYPAQIITEGSAVEATAVFYRPNTKKGDPRMWVYGLTRYVKGDDILVLFKFEGKLCVVNITQIDIVRLYESLIVTPLQEIIMAIDSESNSVADELLGKFRSVSGQWFESEVKADTGIGRTIESFLGISMNSDKTPDYKGIELKSHREKRNSTKNVLFTQTPNWALSKLKSGREIVEHYGYRTPEGALTYQNTVQCTTPNAQNLILNVNENDDLLELQAALTRKEDVAVWQLMTLHNRLATKHRETFWIEVENTIDDNKEFFRYKEIEHTKNPNVGQFDVLLAQDIITLDLLLCRPSGHGDTYSFKIKKKGMSLLFPQSVTYKILE